MSVTFSFIQPQYSFHPRAWLYLLSRMRKPCDLDRFLLRDRDCWDDLLGCSPWDKIGDLVQDGLLQPCSEREKIALHMTVPELKILGKTLGVKLPGKKSEIVDKLFQACPDDMARRAAALHYVKCTPAGLEEIMGYFRYEKALYEGASDRILKQLANGDLSGATETAKAYWETQIFRRANPSQFN